FLPRRRRVRLRGRGGCPGDEPARRRPGPRPGRTVMVELARLTKPKIVRQVGEASIHKAKAYLCQDVWSDLRVQSGTVKGRCQGNAPGPYRVAVTFDGDAIESADCSCPVGAGGHCKHVAALLLYVREHPDAFVEVEDLDPA